MHTHGPSQPKLTMTTASNLDKHCGCGIGLRLDQTCVKNNAVMLPRPYHVATLQSTAYHRARPSRAINKDTKKNAVGN